MAKICRRCNEEKKITRFKVDKRQHDGRTVTCRDCYTFNQLEKRNIDPLQIINCIKAKTGLKHSLEHRLAISRGQKKAVLEGRHPWKRNDKLHKDHYRTKIEYKIWKEKLLENCEKKCEDCSSDKRLHAHHIKCFYKYPELMFSLDNGKILCQSCHSRLHKIRDGTGRKKKVKEEITS